MTGFSSALFADEGEIAQIRRTLERLMRNGFAEDAADRLEDAIGALQDLGHPIVPLCHELARHGIGIEGWERIAEGLTRLYKSDQPITALSIDLSAHGDGAMGEPCIETVFYTDEAFLFSEASREDINAGYDGENSVWAEAFAGSGDYISTVGLAEMHVALTQLHQLMETDEADGADRDAWFIGSSYMAVLLHLAIRDVLMVRGLPRALAILVGSNDYFPCFDAPVVSIGEYRQIAPDLDLGAFGDEPESGAGTEVEIHNEVSQSEASAYEDQAVALELENPVTSKSPDTLTGEMSEVSENVDSQDEKPVALQVEGSTRDGEDGTEGPAKTLAETESALAEFPSELSAGAELRRRLSQLNDGPGETTTPEALPETEDNLLKKLFRRKRA